MLINKRVYWHKADSGVWGITNPSSVVFCSEFQVDGEVVISRKGDKPSKIARFHDINDAQEYCDFKNGRN